LLCGLPVGPIRPSRTPHRLALAACAWALGAVLASPAGAGVNHWTNIGPDEGEVSALVVDPRTPANVYAGTNGGGVFRSRDAGKHWAPVNTGLTDRGILSLAIDPTTPTNIYAGTSAGVFRSADGGDSWSLVLAAFSVVALAVDPVTPTTLYAGEDFGRIFKTSDAGAHWTPVTTGLTSSETFAIAIDPNVPTTVYAATRAGVFKSTDGGTSWSLRNSGLVCDGCLGLECRSCDASVLALVVDPMRPSTLYAGTYGGIFKSTDGGDAWMKVHHNAAYTFAMSPTAPRTVYAASDTGVFASADSGQTWFPAGLASGALSLALDPQHPSIVYAGTTRGVFKRRAVGEPWRHASRGLVAVTIESLAVDRWRPRTLYALSTYGPLFKSTDRGARWRHIELGKVAPRAFALDPRRPATLYAATTFPDSSDGVSKSTDGGKTWRHRVIDDEANILAVAVDPVVPSKIYAVATFDDRGVIFKSIDAGRAWYLLWDPTVDGDAFFIRALAINPANPATLYAASDYEGIFKTTDGGVTWVNVLPDLTVNALAVDPLTPTTIYAGTAAGVFKTTDGGATWTGASTGLDASDVHALAIDPTLPPMLYAGTSGGVFMTTDAGDTWIALNSGLTANNVLCLAIDPRMPRRLYAGTEGGGVFEWRSDGAAAVPRFSLNGSPEGAERPAGWALTAKQRNLARTVTRR
jgi:photosystem II stability/assembly factor-like uncharacterized protein